jgi:hypothetical protein
MKTRQRLWWVLGGAFFLFCVGFVGSAYRFEWSATGFLNKSLWDWLQLLVVPLVLAVVALVFQFANTRTERQIAQQRYEQDKKIALDKQHEDLLQAYLDRISELLLKESLRTSPSEEVRNVARVRTITVLAQLNALRVGYVFTFLREAGLMSTASTSNVVSLKDANLRSVKWGQADLSGANLNGANLSEAYLSNADLSGAYLKEANLSGTHLSNADLSNAHLKGANLNGANLSGANLSSADLSNAHLKGANLSGAYLTSAKVTEEQMKEIRSLEGATMPDGSTHAW